MIAQFINNVGKCNSKILGKIPWSLNLHYININSGISRISLLVYGLLDDLTQLIKFILVIKENSIR